MAQLTPHFALSEFTVSETAARKGYDNAPPQWVSANLKRTAEALEKVRSILGDKPVLITSGYRSPQLNKAVGGSKNSAHQHGLAVDFICPGFGDPRAVCKALEPHMAELGIDQLIHEYDTWVHLGLSASAPRHMALTIDGKGTRTGFA